MNQKELKNELLSLVNRESQYELEKVERYLNLVSIYKGLDKSIKENGSMIEIKNGSQNFLKVNPAIGEKVKVNQALIKLGGFFEKKKELLKLEEKSGAKFNPDSFLE